MDTGKNELSKDYLLEIALAEITFAAFQKGEIVVDPFDGIKYLERAATRHVIREHINESPAIYKNSDVLRRKNNG